MIIFENEFLEISEENGKVYIKTTKTGFLLKDFDAIIRLNPRIKLTNFAVLKNVLTKVTENQVEIGEWLPSMVLEISRDKMSASLFIYETNENIRENKQAIKEAIRKVLAENNIKHGVLDLKLESIVSGKAILIAQGTPPVKGDDAKLTYLEIPERKPVIREDGKADYYDMSFIFEIAEGAWLGEKIPPQPGIPGYNVHDEIVVAQSGRDATLKYDKKSAYEVEEDGKTVLRSRISGVLENMQGVVAVKHHLPINGDVGVETGNIDFTGSISIRGTVQAGYTVIAKGDISIEGAEGVSAAKLIKSTDGDVFIRGGIFGLGQTRVEAGGNIFVKHVNEANLVATEDVHIGFYALGSNIEGHSILVDERKGKIIGGTSIAKSAIVTAISGNHLERRTELIINSVNKQERLAMIQNKAALLKSIHEDIVEQEEQIDRVEPVFNNLTKPQIAAFEQVKQNLNQNKEMALTLDRDIKQMMNDLRNVGKEEIHITKEAYSGTYIQIGEKSSVLNENDEWKIFIGIWRVERIMQHIPIFAHRGASGHALENTLVAFMKAKLLGADGIEVDIQRSKDDILVVFHDIDLIRLVGVKKIIYNCTLDELQQYKLGRRFRRWFSSKRIPTLEEVIKWVNEHQMPINIEIKESLLKDPTALITALRTMQLPENSHFSSFHEELLKIVKEIRPDIDTALIVTKKFDWNTLGELAHIDAVHASKKYYKRHNLKACDEVGMGIRFYGIEGNESFLKNPHPAVIGWITDYPEKVRQQQHRQ